MSKRREPERDGPGGEQEYLANYDPRDYPPVAVAVDVALLTLRAGRLSVLLIARGEPPYEGDWALPGGFVRPDEGLDAAARRELAEETGVAEFDGHVEQLATYGDPDRDPRMRVVSVAYVAITADTVLPRAAADAALARFWPIDDIALHRRRRDSIPLAFDHSRIVADAVERIRAKLEYSSLATRFCEEPFTIADLRRVYEAIWGTRLDPANFQRKVVATEDLLVATGHSSQARGGRPARLYQRGSAEWLNPPLLRP